MAKVKDSYLFHFDDLEIFDDMDDEEIGKLFRDVIRYAKDGIEPEYEERFMKHCFKSLARRHDADARLYEEKCKKNRANISKRWNTTEYDRIETNTTEYETIPSDTKNTDMDMELDMELDMDTDMDTDIPRVPAQTSPLPAHIIHDVKEKVIDEGDLSTLEEETWIRPAKIVKADPDIYVSMKQERAVIHIRDRYGGAFANAIRSVIPDFQGELIFATG